MGHEECGESTAEGSSTLELSRGPTERGGLAGEERAVAKPWDGWHNQGPSRFGPKDASETNIARSFRTLLLNANRTPRHLFRHCPPGTWLAPVVECA